MNKILLDIEMVDGTVYEDVRIILADMIAYSDTARRHGWGSLEDDKIRAMAFMSYAALGRLGKLDRMTYGFEQFTQDCAMVSGDFGDAVDPTPSTTQGDSMQP